MVRFIVMLMCSVSCVANTMDDFELDGPMPTPTPIIDQSKLPKIIADKRNGKISVIFPDTNKTIETPALFGKKKSDILNMEVYKDRSIPNDFVTPAGIFFIKKMFSHRLNEPMLVFIEGQDRVASIHPLWMGNPKQDRAGRLRSPSPDDNRVTGGCINVDPDFFYKVLNNLPDGISLTILPENG